MMPQEGAQAPAQEQESEDVIVDQIGMLIQKLSPDKQKMVVMKLGEMMGAQEAPEAPEAEMGTVSEHAGASGVPAERV